MQWSANETYNNSKKRKPTIGRFRHEWKAKKYYDKKQKRCKIGKEKKIEKMGSRSELS